MGYVVCSNAKSLSLFVPRNSPDLAAWVGAFGSVGAVIAAIWIMDRQRSLSEQNLLSDRAHAAAKEAQNQRDRLTICLMVAAHAAAAIISVLDTLESVDDNDVPWTLANQMSFVAKTSEPTLRIPLHELGTVEAVQCVFAIIHLSHRLSECLAAWSRQDATSVSCISDMRKTVALLKPEAADVFAAIQKSLAQVA